MSKKTHYGGGFPAGPRGAERANEQSALVCSFAGQLYGIWKVGCSLEDALCNGMGENGQGANLFMYLTGPIRLNPTTENGTRGRGSFGKILRTKYNCRVTWLVFLGE